jgi:hypothetical protein
VHHIRRSDFAVQMGSSGFPDLVLARGGRVLFLELKREGAQARADQLAWVNAINGARGLQPLRAFCEARIVHPADLDAILRELAA